MTLHSVDIPDELWKKFVEAIEDEYNSASEAIRDFMRQKIREKQKEA